MDKDQLRQQLLALRTFMFDKGILDDYFLTLESIEESQPNFVENIIRTFFSTSSASLNELKQHLRTKPLDVKKVECLIIKVKGNCGSMGAAKLHVVAGEMLDTFKAKKFHRLNAAFKRVKSEHAALKMHLKPYAELLRQLRLVEPADELTDEEDVESIDSNDIDDNGDESDDY